MKINLRIIALFLVAINIFLASWFFLHGDIVFHTDIARDFLLIEDMVNTRHPAFLGPRSGGIPGVFHGPLWLYLNIPAFILGGGNPVVVGWFWLILFIVSIGVVYWVAKKMFNEEIALVSAVLFSVVSADSIRSLFNPYGAVLLAPLFFYFFWRYTVEKKLKDILIAYFILGLIIQFQMAWGGPILLLTIPYLLYTAIKYKKWNHLLSPLILFIPISTFIAFDLKHQFLQTHAVLNYLSGTENAGKINMPFAEVLNKRIHGIFIDTVNMITWGKTWILTLVLGIFAYVIYHLYKNKDNKYRNLYILFFSFYVGYWAVSTLYKGVMWSYYYWPFLGLVCIFFVASRKFIDKRIFYVIFIVMYASLLFSLMSKTFSFDGYFGRDNSSWKFRRLAAEQVYKDAPQEFGYYIFTADQYGYPTRYAMNYTQRKFADKKSIPFEKRKATYLLIDPSTLSFYNENSWTQGDVRIEKKPAKLFYFASNFRIEKYLLSEEELKVQSNPNLIHTLIFR